MKPVHVRLRYFYIAAVSLARSEIQFQRMLLIQFAAHSDKVVE